MYPVMFRNLKSVPTSWSGELDSLFGDFLRTARLGEMSGGEPRGDEPLAPRIAVTERPDAFQVQAELPGVRKEDISITIEEGVLTLGAEARVTCETDKVVQVLRDERRYGKYLRRLSLGKAVDEKKVSARYLDGILDLTLPKIEAVMPRRIEVGVS